MSDNEPRSLRADNGAVIINGSVVHGSIIQTVNSPGAGSRPRKTSTCATCSPHCAQRTESWRREDPV